MEIKSLPYDIKIQIIEYLDPRSRSQLGAVSKDWYQLANGDAIWRSLDLGNFVINGQLHTAEQIFHLFLPSDKKLNEIAKVLLPKIDLDRATASHLHILYELLDCFEGDYRNRVMIIAITRGIWNLVNVLFRKGVNLGIESRGWAVCEATKTGHSETVEMLLQQGPIPENDRKRALDLSAHNGHLKIVALLLQSGAISEEECGYAAFIATKRADSKMVAILQQNGPISDHWLGWLLCHAATKGYLEIVKIFLHKGLISDKNRDIMISQAAFEGRADMIEILLKNGPISEEARSWAVCIAGTNGRSEVVNLLLQNGSISDDWRNLTVVDAAKNGHLEVVKMLLQNGLISYFYRNQAIFHAAKNGHFDVARALFIRLDLTSIARDSAAVAFVVAFVALPWIKRS